MPSAHQHPETQAPLKREQFQRARSLPHRRPYVSAVFFHAISYLALISIATCIYLHFHHPSDEASRIIMISIFVYALSAVIAYFKSRKVLCPLCKGTPLRNTGARPHSKAWRLRPFSHGTTATLSILASQKFRCMYCGSNFDLLKTPTHRLKHGETDYDD